MPDSETGSYHRRGADFGASRRFYQREFMSVYTSVSSSQLEEFLQRYDLGKAQSLAPIAAGITNSIYMLDTDRGSYVLTLYEHHSDEELDYMLLLQRHLVAGGLRCSQPVGDRQGEFFSRLNQRPAAIMTRIPGEVQAAPGKTHCASIGAELARFHLAGADFAPVRANPRGIDWMQAVRDTLAQQLDEQDQQAISDSLRAAREFDLDQLPGGAIHADLFHDNALFQGDELGGILDFDYACTDAFVFDIAVLLNDWCIDARYQLVPGLVAAVLDAYRAQRPLQGNEIEALPLMLRLAALRFWLSRLYDQAFPLAGELTFIKCPDAFRKMHRLRGEQALIG